MKHYKPGQFVSIEGKLARVRKYTSLFVCNDCVKANKWVNGRCNLNRQKCIEKLGIEFYPKLIKR